MEAFEKRWRTKHETVAQNLKNVVLEGGGEIKNETVLGSNFSNVDSVA